MEKSTLWSKAVLWAGYMFESVSLMKVFPIILTLLSFMGSKTSYKSRWRQIVDNNQKVMHDAEVRDQLELQMRRPLWYAWEVRQINCFSSLHGKRLIIIKFLYWRKKCFAKI